MRSESAVDCSMVASSMGNVVVQATPLDCAYFKSLVVGVVARSGDALPMPWGTLAGLQVFCSSPALHLATAGVCACV